jgi:hypothetical protein
MDAVVGSSVRPGREFGGVSSWSAGVRRRAPGRHSSPFAGTPM